MYLNNARSRATRDNVPFTITLQNLIDIATEECPIFHTPFVWGSSGLGSGKTRPDSPTLDRILPELGYIPGNVAFLSYRANRIKDNGTMQEHYKIADWIWEQTHAKQKSAAPVSKGAHIQGAVGAELGSVSTPWPWEDDDDTHHHCGTISWEDANHRSKEGSRDRMGHGGQEVGTFKASYRFQNYGVSCPAVEKFIAASGHLPDKS